MRNSSKVALGTAVLATAALAQAATWDGGGLDANWGTLDNWNPDGVPGFSTVVTLDSNAPATIGLNVYGRCKSLTITKPGNLTFTKVGSISNLTVDSNAVLTVDPSDGGTYTYSWGDGANNPGSLSNASGDGYWDPVYDIRGANRFIFYGSNSFTANTFTKAGTGTLQYGSQSPAVTSNLSLVPITNINAGVVDSESRYYTYIIGNSTHGSVVNIASGATFQGVLSTYITGGTITFAGKGKVVMNSKLDGTGTRSTLTTRGSIFRPGDVGSWSSGVVNTAGVGVFTVNGNLNFTMNSTTYNKLYIDITGSGAGGAGVDFDQLLQTNGTLTASSLANVDLIINTGDVAAGNTYQFLASANTLVGSSFHSVTYNYTGQTLTPSLTALSNGYQVSFDSIPEPAAVALASVVSLGALALRRRQV